MHALTFYLQAYRKQGIMDKAASLSFYTFISIFPLVIILVSFFTQFLSQEVVVQIISQYVQDNLPHQSELISQNIQSLVKNKLSFGWIGIVFLIFSAQVFYVNFEKDVNQLLETGKKRNFLMTRVFFVLWLIVLVTVLLAPLFFEIFSSHLLSLSLHLGVVGSFLRWGGSLLMSLVSFLGIVFILPTKRPRLKRVWWSAFLFTLSLFAGKFVFKWFAVSSLDRYNIIYGSLGSIVLVMLWVFYFYNLLLFFIYFAGEKRLKGKK